MWLCDEEEDDIRMKTAFVFSRPSDDSNQRLSDVLRSHSFDSFQQRSSPRIREEQRCIFSICTAKKPKTINGSRETERDAAEMRENRALGKPPEPLMYSQHFKLTFKTTTNRQDDNFLKSSFKDEQPQLLFESANQTGESSVESASRGCCAPHTRTDAHALVNAAEELGKVLT